MSPRPYYDDEGTRLEHAACADGTIHLREPNAPETLCGKPAVLAAPTVAVTCLDCLGRTNRYPRTAPHKTLAETAV